MPIPLEVHDGERLAIIGERLAVLAVAARVMARRYPQDVYARSIEREAFLLARSMRDALTVDTAPPAGRIVDAPPTPRAATASASPAPGATPDAAPDTSSALRSATRQDTRRAPRAHAMREMREKPPLAPPEARHAAPASNSTQRTPAPEARQGAPSDAGVSMERPPRLTRQKREKGRGHD